MDDYNWVKNKIVNLRQKVQNFTFERNDEKFTSSLGVWSIKKLIGLDYYIGPFVKIIKSKKNNLKNCYYVDPFSGSGLFKINNKIFPGSPFVALFNDYKFDKYYLSDKNKAYIESLKNRIELASIKENTDIRSCDCNERLAEIFEGVSASRLRENAYLLFLDPYGFDLKWSIMERILDGGSVDIILTFMTSQFNRNKTNVNSTNKLDSFYGKRDQSLNTLDGFVSDYCTNIQNYGNRKYNTFNIPIYNFKGARYDLIFATKSKGGSNVLGDLKKRIDPIDTNLINSAFNVSVENATDLDSYL